MQNPGERGATQPATNCPRVLLVEDYPNLARLLALALESQGYQVRVACDCASALALAGTEPFDIVISDLRLPDGNGHDLMRDLAGCGVRKGIALSVCAEVEDRRASQAAGFAEHLVKPLDPDDLHAAIQRVLQERAPDAPPAPA